MKWHFPKAQITSLEVHRVNILHVSKEQVLSSVVFVGVTDIPSGKGRFDHLFVPEPPHSLAKSDIAEPPPPWGAWHWQTAGGGSHHRNFP